MLMVSTEALSPEGTPTLTLSQCLWPQNARLRRLSIPVLQVFVLRWSKTSCVSEERLPMHASNLSSPFEIASPEPFPCSMDRYGTFFMK